MRGRVVVDRRLALGCACALLFAWSGCPPHAESRLESAPSYPAPRFPQWLVHPSDDELLNAARIAVTQTSGRAPLGRVHPGETVHVLITADQDARVWEAIRKAWAERGVTARPVQGWEWTDMTREQYEARAARNRIDGSGGWKEFGVFEPAFVRFLPPAVQATFGQPMTTTVMLGGIEYPPDLEHSQLKKYLDQHPDVQHFYAFAGGGPFVRRAAGERNATKFEGNWIYFTPSDLESHAAAFPADVWRLIDESIVRPIASVSEGTFYDPQGTRLHWYLTPAQSHMWDLQSGPKAYVPNHLNIYPAGTNATWSEGTIVSTANHAGFYPQMTVHISQHGRVLSVEGGGEAGRMFGHLLEHPALQSARFPSAPESGYWYLAQDGLGTNPKVVRNMQMLTGGATELANLSERDRAGIQHFAYASPVGPNPEPDPTSSPADVQYARQQHLPLSHLGHMHVYFGTARWRLRDTGEWVTVLDKGRLTAFDDPEVRALASRYGDPDVLFSYDWIPAIPGINTAGEYGRDFAPDPWKWWQREWRRITSGAYDFFVKPYRMAATP